MSLASFTAATDVLTVGRSGKAMGTPPRTEDFFRPLLEDIRDAASHWHKKLFAARHPKPRWAGNLSFKRLAIVTVLAVAALTAAVMLRTPLEADPPGSLTDRSLEGSYVAWSGTVVWSGTGSFNQPMLWIDHDDGTRIYAHFSDSWRNRVGDLTTGQRVRVAGKLSTSGDLPHLNLILYHSSVALADGT